MISAMAIAAASFGRTNGRIGHDRPPDPDAGVRGHRSQERRRRTGGRLMQGLEPTWLIRGSASRRRHSGAPAIRARSHDRTGARIDPIEIERALAMPARHEHRPDGRIRHWRWVAEPGRWLRVVSEADGETVHNAFWDRDFQPCSLISHEPAPQC